ncbi:hypothetical protein K466DRAFT_473922, partial [Polyporus arcularius HHB13444]
GPPAALSLPSDPKVFVTDPTGIKDATVKYFTELFQRAPRAPSQKPWMTTPSVVTIREHLRALLRKGNARPAPGPDLWEKWCIKALSDSALSLVLDLVNYEILHSHFPDSVKPAIMTTIFKRGSRTDLSNYRGITCSNLIKNLPFAWLNHHLSAYITQQGILPETQVATQPGVQARDLTSFLSHGFDRLEPEGFYDAVRAYGLPESLIALDQSAQHNVPCQVKTVHGLTQTFTLSGVTQQGGPFSPLKSTLTTSMANHWLRDVLQDMPDNLTFVTHQGSRGKPHTPDDRLRLCTQMVEAMDDSILLMPTLAATTKSALFADRFQAAYGWETNWSKSLL